jgi:hypothetical protein
MTDFMIYFTLTLSGRLTMPALLFGTFIGAILIALTGIVGCLLEACKPLSRGLRRLRLSRCRP